MKSTSGNHEGSTHEGGAESPVAPRFSLSDGQISRRDFFVDFGGTKDRFLDYPSPTEWRAQVMTFLREQGLLLGEQYDSEVEGHNRFKIPKEARPVAYDSPMLTRGEYSYYDTRLFRDLGVLLSRLGGSLGEHTAVKLAGNIGTNVAILDFTLPEQRGLFLVPGIELCTEIADTSEDHLGYYKERLSVEFDRRFSPEARDSFDAGYQAGT